MKPEWADQGVRRKDVSLVIMDNREANKLVEEHHYLHRKRVGRLLSYAVCWRGEPYGVLMYARPMVCHPIFGYPPKQVVELARFWLRENLKNLGSCAIRASFRRILQDWPGTRAIISWCDTTHFDGALYKACGFEYRGLSRVRAAEPSGAQYGGGRPSRTVHGDRLNRKQRWFVALLPPQEEPI